jgi:hypothetical protein
MFFEKNYILRMENDLSRKSMQVRRIIGFVIEELLKVDEYLDVFGME